MIVKAHLGDVPLFMQYAEKGIWDFVRLNV